jgi:hypothetical protein
MKISLTSLFSAADRSWKTMHAVCGLQSCPNTLIMRSVAQSKVGIRSGQVWYCSVDCFAGAARAKLSSFTTRRVVEMPHNPRMTVGLMMLSKGYLTDEQLRVAINQSQMHGEVLEYTLLRLGMANEGQLTAAKAAQWGHPVFGQEVVNLPVEADIPPTLLRSSSAVPLHYSVKAKRLLLGFVDRVEHSLLDSMEQIIGCRADPCFITPSKYAEQMAQLTAAPSYEEVVFTESLTPSQQAKSIASFAVDISATEAAFTQSKNFIWTRLSGRRRKIDLLFRSGYAVDIEDGEKFRYLKEKMSSLG